MSDDRTRDDIGSLRPDRGLEREISSHNSMYRLARGWHLCHLRVRPARRYVPPPCRELEGLGVKAGAAFVEWLLDEEHLVEIEMRNNALVLYFDQGSWKHVGIMKDGDRVTSKWGTYGVFAHRLSKVPSDYGNQVRFFELPSTVEPACLLFRFACSELAPKPREIDWLRKITGMSE